MQLTARLKAKWVINFIRSQIIRSQSPITNSSFFQEQKKILYYFPEECELDTKIKDIGLCEAIIKFTKWATPMAVIVCLLELTSFFVLSHFSLYEQHIHIGWKCVLFAHAEDVASVLSARNWFLDGYGEISRRRANWFPFLNSDVSLFRPSMCRPSERLAITPNTMSTRATMCTTRYSSRC